MAPAMFCQSCTMPIDTAEYKGTEKDGSKSNDYCKYCYRAGQFTNPGLTVEEMKTNIRFRLQQMKLPESVLQKSLDLLPHLKRWRLAPHP